jgi:hypothetical protein
MSRIGKTGLHQILLGEESSIAFKKYINANKTDCQN